jgi:predicted Zn-dependent peptidase
MKYKKTVLENGLRVVTVPMKNNPTVTVFVLVEAGSKYENKKNNGISHFLEHMCFKGTKKRPNMSDISLELDSVGSHYNASTSQESTCYYAKAQYNHIDKLLDVVSDMYLNPLFDKKEIEKEKGVIIEEINMYEDLPQRKVEDVFNGLLYGDQPAGWNIAGPKENIRAMTREDFVDYRRQFYVPKATTVVVAGNINETKVLKDIKGIFSPVRGPGKGIKKKVIEKQAAPKISIFKKETDQTHLIFGVRTFDIHDRRNRVMKVLKGVLGGGMSSRLWQKLRDEMGVCYYVHVSHDALTDHGVFYISAGVDNKRVKEVIKVFISELNNLKTSLVSAKELKKVKQYLTGTIYLNLESSDDIAGFYGFQEIMNEKIKTPEDIKKEIESVTAEEVMALAKEIFTDAGLNLAIVGRFEDEGEFKKILKF